MADAKSLIDAIHKEDPLPQGKIDKKSKEDNLNKLLDSALIDEHYKAAKFLYTLMSTCFGIKGKNFFDREKDASASEALSALMNESEEPDSNEPKEDGSKLTKKDLKYKDFATKLLNPETPVVYAYTILESFSFDVSKDHEVVTKKKNNEQEVKQVKGNTVNKLFGVIRSKADQTTFIRSANHAKAILEKNDDYYYDGITKIPGYDDFKKVFPDVASNYEANHFNGDVDTGVNPYVVNALIGLINKSIKQKKPDGTTSGSFKINAIKIPKDKVEADKESSIKSGTNGLNSMLNNVIKNLVASAVKAVMKDSISIKQVANVLREATTKIEDDWILKVGEQNPEFQGKTFADLEQEWKNDHFRQMDLRDAKVLQQLNSAVGSDGQALKKYIDRLNDAQINELFDTLSRQVYLATDGKTTLQSWDKSQNWLCLSNFKPFDDFTMNDELTNRDQDKADLDEYNQNRDDCGIDDLVYLLKGIEEGTARDEEGNLIISPEEFESNYPSMADDKELARVIGVICQAPTDAQTELSQELGSVLVTQKDKDTFTSLNKDIQNEMQNNRINLYQKLNVLMGNATANKVVELAGNDELFNKVKSTVTKENVKYDIDDYGEVIAATNSLNKLKSIESSKDPEFIKWLSVARCNAMNQIPLEDKVNPLPEYAQLWNQLSSEKESFTNEMNNLDKDKVIDELRNKLLPDGEFSKPEEFQEYNKQVEVELKKLTDPVNEKFYNNIKKIISDAKLNFEFNRESTDKDWQELIDVITGKKDPPVSKEQPDNTNKPDNQEGSQNDEGSQNEEPEETQEQPTEPEDNNIPSEPVKEGIKCIANYLEKYLG